MSIVAEQSWTEPIARWHASSDSSVQHERLQRRGALLARWPQLPFEPAPTDCFQVGVDYWIWQPGVGGMRCLADRPEFDAYSSREVAPAWFEQLVTRSWLPAAYPLWGRQVLHASAAVHCGTGDVVAFSGPSGAGKSTLAYALGSRSPWRLLCDDTLAFSIDRRRVVLHPLRNESRLRPASAAHFGTADRDPQPIIWPSGPLRLSHVFVVSGEDRIAHDVTITSLKASGSYLMLLQQAYALTLEVPRYNQQLMRNYLALATTVPASRLLYRRSFDAIDAVLDGIDAHLAIS